MLFGLLPELPPRTALEDTVVVQAVVFRPGPAFVPEILLVHRTSPRAWELPGGHPDHDEAIEATAIRETREETGIDAVIVGRLADCLRTGFLPHVSPTLLCEAVAGVPVGNHESVEVRYFPVDRLPWGLLPWYRPVIAEALLLRHAYQVMTADRPGGRLACGERGPAPRRHQSLGVAEVAMAGLIHLGGIVGTRR
jgi:8-oxo-dGTP pyrophosphatase MutT (NUDIX family)